MTSPLGIVTLGMLGGSGAATYLEGGIDVAAQLAAIDVAAELILQDAAAGLARIDVDMTEDPVATEVEIHEIAVTA